MSQWGIVVRPAFGVIAFVSLLTGSTILHGAAQTAIERGIAQTSPAEAPGKRAGPPTNGDGKNDKRPAFAPEVTIHDEDYAHARQRFHTKLIRQGPSPQPWSPVKAPAGVAEIEYHSGPLSLKAWLHRPTDQNINHPAVLFLHGGFAFGLEDWQLGQPYQDAGFVVLMPILRGENGQPGAYSFFYDEVDDVLAAAGYLRKRPDVDATHLYIAGPSAGGTVALLSAMTARIFRASASFSASPDQVLLCRHAKHAARDVPLDIKDREELEMRSPLPFAASLKCPTRIYFGTQEPHFRTTSQRMAEVARQHGLDVEAVAVPGGHESSLSAAIRQSIAFFQKQ